MFTVLEIYAIQQAFSDRVEQMTFKGCANCFVRSVFCFHKCLRCLFLEPSREKIIEEIYNDLSKRDLKKAKILRNTLAPNTSKIVAFIAPAGSGKTTATSFLPDFQRVSFAEPLKNLGAQIGLDCYTRKEEIHPKLGFSARQFMRATGDALRHLPLKSKEGWTFTTLVARAKIEELQSMGENIVIDDLRYEEEYSMLAEKGALFLKIDREDVVIDRSHASETEMERMKADFIIENNGSLEKFSDEIIDCIGYAFSYDRPNVSN